MKLLMRVIPYPGFAQEDILAFYEKAYARTQLPPDESGLSIICQQKLEDYYITFMGTGGQKVLLAAFSKEKLDNPNEDVWLKWRLVTPGEKRKGGKTMDWGYVYDRNGDGQIDYIAYLMGPMPIKGKSFPENFPKLWEKLNLEQLSFVVKNHYCPVKKA